MAANYFESGSASKDISFPRAVRHLNLFVNTGVTFSISFDGDNYMTVPAGFSNFPVGPVTNVWISADGDWQLWAVQG